MKQLLTTLEKMRSGEIVKKSGFTYSEKTIKFYEDVVKSLKIGPKTTLKDIQKQLRERGVSSVTERNYIDAMKVLMTHSGIKFEDLKVKVYQSTIHIPAPERVWQMIKTYQPDSKQTSWAFRYLTAEFLTSARISDLMKLDQSNIHIQDGREYLVYNQGKTNKQVRIPMTPLLKEQFSATGNLLPRIPYSSLRGYVKNVYRAAGFTRLLKSSKMVNGQMIEVEMKEYEAYGTHRLRASGITNLLQSGLTELEAKQISGHSKNSSSFGRYVSFSQSHIDEKFLKAMQ